MPTIADEIVIRISADLQKFKGELLAAIGETKNFKREIDGVDKSTQVLNQGLKAFSWTTFAQGALNASTAMAQLYTSVSNLARVQYQLKSALTAVEKAEDQIARKTLQLSRELDKHGKSSEKAALLINEIETAYDQLENKQERVKLAQDQVNDTYVLFGFNLTNTLFGIAQTIIGLKSMLAQKALLITATKGVAIAQGDLLKSTLALSGSQGVLLKTTEALTYAYTKNAIAANVMAGSTARAAASGGGFGKIMGGLTSALGGMSLRTAGGSIALAALAVGLGSAAVKMDMVDGKLDGMSARFSHATVEGAKFGRQIELITDMGDPFVNTLNSMGEALSLGMWKAPDLSKFTDETKKKIKEEFGSFGANVENQQQLDEARLKKQKHDLEVLENSRKAFVARGLQGGVSPTSMNLGISEAQEINSIVQEQFSYRSAIHDIEKRTGKELSSNVDIMNDYLDIQVESGRITTAQLGMYKQQIVAQQKLNDEAEKGNKINGKTLELQQQIMALKKKLSPHFLLQEATRSASTGEFTRDLIKRILGDKAESMIGYQPFRGEFTKENGIIKQIQSDIQLMRLDQKIAIIVSEMEQQILAGNPDRVKILRDRLEEAVKGRNFVSSKAKNPTDQKLSSMMSKASSDVNNLFRSIKATGATSGYGAIHGSGLGVLGGGISQATMSAMGIGAGKIRNFSLSKGTQGTNLSKRSIGGSAKARKGGGRGRNRNYDPLGGMGISSGIESEARRNVIAQMQFLGDIIGVGINIQGTSGIDITPQLRGYRSPSAEYINSVVTGAIANYNASVQRYNAQLSVATHDILTRVNPLGITTISGLYASVTDPLTYDDVDNRLRYNDRLAQISTGATVL